MSWDGDRGQALMIEFILPMALVSSAGRPGEIKVDAFLGTAFVVGDGSVALTAGHVIPHFDDHQALALMKRVEDGWWSVGIDRWEMHPTEDVAILRLAESLPPLTLKVGQVHQSSSYGQMGYPENVLLEVVPEDGSPALIRPDLIYFQGYVRRRLSDTSIPGLRGDQLFELSESSGAGTSGSPIWIQNRTDEVFAVYIGERITAEDPPRRIAFAVRIDSILDWQPVLLGKTLREVAT